MLQCCRCIDFDVDLPYRAMPPKKKPKPQLGAPAIPGDGQLPAAFAKSAAAEPPAAPVRQAPFDSSLEPSADDSPLKQVTKTYLRQLSAHDMGRLRLQLEGFKGNMSVASACSGSEIARVSLGILVNIIGRCTCSTAFSCEQAENKRGWIKHIIEPYLNDDQGCLYPDVCELHHRATKCVKHGECCEVRQADFFSAGFSCKSFSKLFKSRKLMGTALQQEIGSSGTTFGGVLRYLESHSPRIVVLENVEDIMSSSESNYPYLVEQFHRLSYDVASTVAMSSDFGSPQRRKRAYMIAFKIPAHQDVRTSTAAASAIKLMESFASPGNVLPLETFLLSASRHPRLESELRRRQKEKASRPQASSPSQSTAWKTKHQRFLSNDGRPVSSCILDQTDRAGEWFQLLTDRQQMVLGNVKSLRPNYKYADVYQSIGREFVSEDADQLTTLVPGSVVWLREHKRLLTGVEALHVQMIPPALLADDDRLKANSISDCLMMDLAGNMFTGTVFAAAAIAALVCAPAPGVNESMERSASCSAIDSTADAVAGIFDF